MVELKNIQEVINFVARLEQTEPYTEEQLLRDLKLSENGDYEVQASIKSKGALTFVVPDISRPLSLMRTEAGMAVVEGFGRAFVKFKQGFNETPGLVKTTFGFFELRVPWVVIEWRSVRIAWWTIRLPVPSLRTMTIRLPTMCFLMNVRKDGFEVFNVIGRTYITYMAVGR